MRGDGAAKRATRETGDRDAARHGFTLLELLVALVLLDVGIVALVSASAAVGRVQSGARSDAAALSVASSSIERLLALPCRGFSSGTNHPATGTTEWWSDVPVPNGTREVADSVLLITPRGPRTVVLHSAGRC